MVRFENKKLIIEIDYSCSDPQEELCLLSNSLIELLRTQSSDFYPSSQEVNNRILDFLAQIMPTSEQIVKP